MRNFQTIVSNLDTMIAEHGFYKTANLLAGAYELDLITESQGCSIRFMLSVKYENYTRNNGDHFLGIESLELPERLPETNHDALMNRSRTACSFPNAVNGMCGPSNDTLMLL